MLKPLVLAFAAVMFAALAPAPAARCEDRVILVPDDDAEMNAAIAKARSTLSDFWREMEAPGLGVESFSLKVAIPYGASRHEHFWLTDIQRRGDKISGIISNDPNNATHVVKGERYEFTEADISDWLIRRNGKMVGNETMRPLLKRMPKEPTTTAKCTRHPDAPLRAWRAAAPPPAPSLRNSPVASPLARPTADR